MRAKAVKQNEIFSSSSAIIWLIFEFMFPVPCTARSVRVLIYFFIGPLFKSRLLSAFAFA